MWKYFRLAYLSIEHKLAMNVLCILQICALLLLSNVVLAQYNNRYMLYEPYQDILAEDGYYFDYIEGLEKYEIGYEGGTNQGLMELLSELRGDITTYVPYEMGVIGADGALIEVIIMDDFFFENFSLPLASGSIDNMKAKDGKIMAISSPNINDIEKGSMLNINDLNVEIAGVLTNVTYRPNYNNYSISNNISMIYEAYALDNLPIPFIMIRKSACEKIWNEPEQFTIWPQGGAFIVYNQEPSEDIRIYNEQVLGEDGTVVELSKMKRNTLDYVNGSLKSMMPIIITALVIVLIGMISCVAINTITEKRNFGIFFLFGCRWKSCLKICLCITLMDIFAALLLGMTAVLIGISRNINFAMGLVFRWNNLFITLLLIAILLILSIIIPFTVLRKSTPVEVIREGE